MPPRTMRELLEEELGLIQRKPGSYVKPDTGFTISPAQINEPPGRGLRLEDIIRDIEIRSRTGQPAEVLGTAGVMQAESPEDELELPQPPNPEMEIDNEIPEGMEDKIKSFERTSDPVTGQLRSLDIEGFGAPKTVDELLQSEFERMARMAPHQAGFDRNAFRRVIGGLESRRKEKRQDERYKTEQELKDERSRVDFERKKELAEAKLMADLEKTKMETLSDIKQAELKNAGTSKGKIIPANQAVQLGDIYGAIEQLDLLTDKASEFKDVIGPVKGFQKLNPYSTSAQSFQQLLKTTKQIIGKGLEGGVLRKEDENKYDLILPKQNDTMETLAQKQKQLRKMILIKQGGIIEALSQAGYNTSSFVPADEYKKNSTDAGLELPSQTKQPITSNEARAILKEKGFSDSDIEAYIKERGFQ